MKIFLAILLFVISNNAAAYRIMHPTQNLYFAGVIPVEFNRHSCPDELKKPIDKAIQRFVSDVNYIVGREILRYVNDNATNYKQVRNDMWDHINVGVLCVGKEDLRQSTGQFDPNGNEIFDYRRGAFNASIDWSQSPPIYTDAEIWIDRDSPEFRIARDVRHELGHLLGAGHSACENCLMSEVGNLAVEKSMQWQETFAWDDLCMIHERYEIYNWPYVRPYVDDKYGLVIYEVHINEIMGARRLRFEMFDAGNEMDLWRVYAEPVENCVNDSL